MEKKDIIEKKNLIRIALFVASYLIFRFILSHWHSIEMYVKNIMQ